jgi:hypothetical protein
LKHLLGSPLFLGSCPYPTILDLARKICLVQKPPVLFCLGVKSGITVVPDVSRIGANVFHFFPLDPKDLVAMLENFFSSGACIIKLITAVIYGFRNKLECLSLNTRLGWKGLSGTNTLAYYGNRKLLP